MQKKENRLGYKKTKVGWIPEDWDIGVLKDLVTLQRGFDLPSRDRSPGDYPVVSSAGITDSHAEWSATPPGVVTGRYGTIGGVYFVDRPYWPLNTTLFSRDLHGNCAKYVYYFLQQFDFRRFSAKTGVPGVNRNDLHREPSALPPLPEQDAIAEVLECWDKAIRGYERKIETKRVIKKGLMQGLLSGRRRLPGFGDFYHEGHEEHEEKGKGIPSGWKEVRLGSFTTWTSGGTPSKNDPLFWDGEIPWISAATMKGNRFSDSRLRITKAGLQSGSRLTPAGTLLLLVRGSMLFKRVPVGIAERAVAFNQDVKAIAVNGRTCSSGFLLLWILGNENRLKGMVSQTGIGAGKLDVAQLKTLHVELPPLPEQQAIASVLSSADGEIDALERKLGALKDQKRFLLNNMVTGTIRLLEFRKDSP